MYGARVSPPLPYSSSLTPPPLLLLARSRRDREELEIQGKNAGQDPGPQPARNGPQAGPRTVVLERTPSPPGAARSRRAGRETLSGVSVAAEARRLRPLGPEPSRRCAGNRQQVAPSPKSRIAAHRLPAASRAGGNCSDPASRAGRPWPHAGARVYGPPGRRRRPPFSPPGRGALGPAAWSRDRALRRRGTPLERAPAMRNSPRNRFGSIGSEVAPGVHL